MTTESYAAAVDLVARAAAAYVSGVPEHPADEGYFGPGSVVWRVSTDPGSTVAGLTALMVQALHPLAMAGVDQHSFWREDPVGRLAATLRYEVTITFGDTESARRASGRVRRVHEHVRGVDPVTGQPYEAGDPALLLWVHAGLVVANLATSRLFGTPLSAADTDQYIAEMVNAAELVGIPAAQVPSSQQELDRYLDSVRPQLQCTPAASESMSYLLDPPGLDEAVAEIWQDVRDGAVGALPDWAREMYGYQAPRLDEARRTEIRQALGLLDTVYLGEPGVLEARQRIALRMRAAQSR
jgi:uncharacterized protein (DUF2236 family)